MSFDADSYQICFLFILDPPIIYIYKTQITTLGLYNLQTYINCYMLSKDKKLLDYPEVNIQLKIESRMKNNILRKICGIRDRLPDPDPYSDIRIKCKDWQFCTHFIWILDNLFFCKVLENFCLKVIKMVRTLELKKKKKVLVTNDKIRSVSNWKK